MFQCAEGSVQNTGRDYETVRCFKTLAGERKLFCQTSILMLLCVGGFLAVDLAQDAKLKTKRTVNPTLLFFFFLTQSFALFHSQVG